MNTSNLTPGMSEEEGVPLRPSPAALLLDNLSSSDDLEEGRAMGELVEAEFRAMGEAALEPEPLPRGVDVEIVRGVELIVDAVSCDDAAVLGLLPISRITTSTQ